MSLVKRLPGETPWDAVLAHYGMDIDEEISFRRYVVGRGASEGASLEVLELLYEQWKERQAR